MSFLFKNGFAINPSQELNPSLRISPFTSRHIALNKSIYTNNRNNVSCLAKSFIGNNYVFTSSGKKAISLALKYYNLESEDNVWILTTSGNKYISGCVTHEIEKQCKWSREYKENTKVIFVNHEFGYPFTNWEILNYNLPIIEDVAHSFFSTDGTNTTLKGDFVIYSLPKYFPLQFGGILKINNGAQLFSDLTEDANSYLRVLVDHYLQEADVIKSKRLSNYYYYKDLFATINYSPHFEMKKGIIPGVFMFDIPNTDGGELKKFMQGNGVESSVFYGRDAFFVPINQALEEPHLELIFSLCQVFIHGNF